jgi:hypothetical protein
MESPCQLKVCSIFDPNKLTYLKHSTLHVIPRKGTPTFKQKITKNIILHHRFRHNATPSPTGIMLRLTLESVITWALNARSAAVALSPTVGSATWERVGNIPFFYLQLQCALSLLQATQLCSLRYVLEQSSCHSELHLTIRAYIDYVKCLDHFAATEHIVYNGWLN